MIVFHCQFSNYGDYEAHKRRASVEFVKIVLIDENENIILESLVRTKHKPNIGKFCWSDTVGMPTFTKIYDDLVMLMTYEKIVFYSDLVEKTLDDLCDKNSLSKIEFQGIEVMEKYAKSFGEKFEQNLEYDNDEDCYKYQSIDDAATQTSYVSDESSDCHIVEEAKKVLHIYKHSSKQE